jgi:adenylate cyclase
VEAHAAYLRGLAVFQTNPEDPKTLERAAADFRQSLKLDPGFAAAWTRLASVLINQHHLSEGRIAAERALKLDPNLPDAYVAMAKVLINQDLDIGGGERYLKQALELDPNNSWALSWATLVSIFRGQLDEGVRLAQQGLRADPVNPLRFFDLSRAYLYDGKYGQAIGEIQRLSELLPGVDLHCEFAYVYMAKGDPAMALTEIDRIGDKSLRDDCDTGLVFYALGRRADGDAVYARYVAKHAKDDAYGIAMTNAFRGELDQAFYWLERAYRQGEFRLLFVKVEPFAKNLRSDPRYTTLLRKLRLSE